MGKVWYHHVPQEIYTSKRSFMAILADRSVVVWGHPEDESMSDGVQLQHVQRIQASSRAFTAVFLDGSMVSWGDPADGGDSTEVQDQLVEKVHLIKASRFGHSFAAILANGRLVTWGNPHRGGDSESAERHGGKPPRSTDVGIDGTEEPPKRPTKRPQVQYRSLKHKNQRMAPASSMKVVGVPEVSAPIPRPWPLLKRFVVFSPGVVKNRRFDSMLREAWNNRTPNAEFALEPHSSPPSRVGGGRLRQGKPSK